MSDTPTSGSNYPIVVELVEGHQFNVTFEVSTATRIFTTATPIGATTLTLPAIGSPYSDDWPLMTLKSISQSFMGNRPNCPKKYTCSYDTRPLPTMELLVDPTPTFSYEIGADYMTYTNPTTNDQGDTLWTWHQNSGNTNAPDVIIPKLEYRTTITATRYLYADNLDDWYAVSNARLGTINLTRFIGFDPGFVLYTGAQITKTTSENNRAAWRAELKFIVRMVYNSDDTNRTSPLDWDYVYDVKTNKYMALELTPDGIDTGVYLHASTEFADLLSVNRPLVSTPNPNWPR